MSPAKTKRTTNAVSNVPQNRDEMTAVIMEIGETRRQIARVEADMNDELAAIKAKHEERADPLRDKLSNLETAAQMYAEANRDQLTNMGKLKTVEFPSGKVAWRLKPPSIRFRAVKDVVAQMQSLQLGRFLREKIEPDKEAMLKEPDVVATIKGVTVVSGEESFAIEPFEAGLQSGEAA